MCNTSLWTCVADRTTVVIVCCWEFSSERGKSFNFISASEKQDEVEPNPPLDKAIIYLKLRALESRGSLELSESDLSKDINLELFNP